MTEIAKVWKVVKKDTPGVLISGWLPAIGASVYRRDGENLTVASALAFAEPEQAWDWTEKYRMPRQVWEGEAEIVGPMSKIVRGLWLPPHVSDEMYWTEVWPRLVEAWRSDDPPTHSFDGFALRVQASPPGTLLCRDLRLVERVESK